MIDALEEGAVACGAGSMNLRLMRLSGKDAEAGEAPSKQIALLSDQIADDDEWRPMINRAEVRAGSPEIER